MTDVYIRPAHHLDSLPAGFPATESGVEIRILKRLFSEEEADVAAHLVMMPEPVAGIAARTGRDESALEAMLASMSKKGLIFRSTKNGQKHYMAAQFVIGIWEYHLNDLDEDLIRDVNEYLPVLMKKAWVKQETKQLRVVPIAGASRRRCPSCPTRPPKRSSAGRPGSWFLRASAGGSTRWWEKGAASPWRSAWSQKPSNICMCCGCCCQVLKNLKSLDSPAKAVHTNYFAAIAPENCTACEACVSECQMGALAVADTAEVDRARCIGCGVCVPACPSDAISLLQKDEPDRYVPPRNVFETHLNMARERGKIPG